MAIPDSIMHESSLKPAVSPQMIKDGSAPGSTRVRSNFPESWIWVDAVTRYSTI